MELKTMIRLLFVVVLYALPLVCVAESVVAAPKALASYPQGDRLWLGSFGGEVAVNLRVDLLVSRPGEIKWLVADEAEVKEGQALVLASAVQVRQSAEQLAIDEDAISTKLKNVEWQHLDKLIGLERQAEELESRIAKLSPTPKERDLLGDGLLKGLAVQTRKLKSELNTLNEKRDPQFCAEDLSIEQRQLRQDLEKARADHDELVHSLEILSPNDGVVHILKSDFVRSNDIIGTVERRGVAVVTMQLLDPELRSEPPESLAISVSSPKGDLISGSFSHIDRMTNVRLGPMIYHFNLDQNPEVPFTPDLSGERMITLYKLLNQQVRIVPKAEFLFTYPQEIQRLGWAGFLKTVWPAARIVHIGPRSIALVEKE